MIHSKEFEWETLGLSLYIHLSRDRKLQRKALMLGWSLVSIGTITSQQCTRRPLTDIRSSSSSIEFLGRPSARNKETDDWNQSPRGVFDETRSTPSRHIPASRDSETVRSFRPVKCRQDNGCILEGTVQFSLENTQDNKRRYFLTIKGWTAMTTSLHFLAYQWIEGTDDESVEGSLWAIPAKYLTQDLRRISKRPVTSPFRYEFTVQLILPSIDASRGIYIPECPVHFILGKSDKGLAVIGDLIWGMEPRMMNTGHSETDSPFPSMYDASYHTSRNFFPTSIKALLRFHRNKKAAQTSPAGPEMSASEFADDLFDELAEDILARDITPPPTAVSAAYEFAYELLDACTKDALGVIDVPELPIPYAVSLIRAHNLPQRTPRGTKA
eukprot:TRINITY_DN9496_c0_g1_i2.p1 TRINITY_DN9496_c0_g1~~TRINITY_DN9496_c0_g1_i2.p1  ORF type:complete len:384 (+),score=75.17 TRINITY_DN9496_c0_g1_i2:179-1330(+)